MAFTHEREAAFMVAQYGVETTWGTAVPATVQLGSSTVEVTPKFTTNPFTPRGFLLPTMNPRGQQYAEISFDGVLSHPECSAIIKDVISDVQTDPVSYSIRHGQGNYGALVTGAVITGWTITGNLDEIRYTATAKGKYPSYGNNMTSGLSNPAGLMPFSAPVTTISVGGTSVLKAFDWEVSVEGLWDKVHYIGSADPANVLQTAITGTFNFSCAADATGLGFLASGAEVPCIITSEFGTTPNRYTLKLEFQAIVNEPSSMKDEQGVYAITNSFSIMNKATKAIAVTMSKS